MESEKEYKFNASQLEKDLSSLTDLGITRLIVADEAITSNKEDFFRFVCRAQEEAPDIFYKFYLNSSVIDGQVADLRGAVKLGAHRGECEHIYLLRGEDIAGPQDTGIQHHGADSGFWQLGDADPLQGPVGGKVHVFTSW